MNSLYFKQNLLNGQTTPVAHKKSFQKLTQFLMPKYYIVLGFFEQIELADIYLWIMSYIIVHPFKSIPNNEDFFLFQNE